MAVIHIIRTPATPEQIAEILQAFDELALRELYWRDAIPIRLGNLASSVKRLGFLIYSKKPEKSVQQLFQECRFFSKWTAPDASRETQSSLAARSRQLAKAISKRRWQRALARRNQRRMRAMVESYT